MLKLKTLLYFIPGLITLCFSMWAIHTHVALVDDHERLRALHERQTLEQGGLSHQAIALGNIIGMLEEKSEFAYWAIIALGLCGFLLVVLNADQLIRLNKMNDEKKKSLQLLEHRLAAMEATMDGIILIDPDLNITYLNNAMAGILGLREREYGKYLNKTWLNFFSHNQELEKEEGALPIVEEGQTWHGVLSLRADQMNQKIDLTLAPLDDGGMIGIARDVTDKMNAENEKKEIQSQLYQAQKMEAIGRLAGGIAHDFNNILAAMNGYAEFLIDDLDKETPQHDFANNILQAGQQARSLVDKMLTFSRHQGSEFEVINLMTPVDESLLMLQASLPKRVEVKTNFASDSVAIEGNATQISQVLMNLCVNAKDAMEHGRGELFVEVNTMTPSAHESDKWLLKKLPSSEDVPLTRIEDCEPGVTELYLSGLARGQDYACLSVEDTGSGMSRSVMEHVFEPFFTTKAVDKGTGLGLSTAHGVMTAHKGALKIRSEVGQGTRFELYFPLANEEELAVTQSSTGSSQEQGSGYILLVDDQKEVGTMTATMLERLGYETKYVQSAEAALEALYESPDDFDLVLTDHNMPKMTGLELVQKAHTMFPDTPFILLSGYSEQKLQDLMKEHPAIRASLRKPVKKDRLGEVLSSVLSEGLDNVKQAV